VLILGDLGGGVPPPVTLIYRGLPPIKLLLFRAFLESLDFVTKRLELTISTNLLRYKLRLL
jgi:hypothetical protein